MYGRVHICDSISHIFVNVSAAGVCIPYSQQACRDAAVSLGLSVPTSGFSGPFKHKGCYAYSAGTNKGKAFYGTGGSRNEMQKQLPDDRYRPKNYDCAAGNYVLLCMLTYICKYMYIYVCMSVCAHAYVYSGQPLTYTNPANISSGHNDGSTSYNKYYRSYASYILAYVCVRLCTHKCMVLHV